MTHATRFVAVAVLVALAAGTPVQGQTPEIDALRARAEAGVTEAQYDLGNMYRNGRGVPQGNAEAVHWYRLAADQGVARAQYGLGFMYDNGRDVRQDKAEAARWYRLAADQGYVPALTNLGNMYETGEGGMLVHQAGRVFAWEVFDYLNGEEE